MIIGRAKNKGVKPIKNSHPKNGGLYNEGS
jgi:hypothetical protein